MLNDKFYVPYVRHRSQSIHHDTGLSPLEAASSYPSFQRVSQSAPVSPVSSSDIGEDRWTWAEQQEDEEDEDEDEEVDGTPRSVDSLFGTDSDHGDC